MTPPPIPLAVIMLLVLGAFVVRAAFERKVLKRARAAAEREYDMLHVASYFNNLEADTPLLSNRTWNDLDMDEVYQRIERTVSWPGQHLLYARLRETGADIASPAFETAVDFLQQHADTRTAMRTALAPLGDDRTRHLTSLFQGSLPSVPAYARMFPLLTVAGLIALATAWWWPVLWLGVGVLALGNQFIRVAMKERMSRVVPAVRMLPALVRAAERMSHVDAPPLQEYRAALRLTLPKLRWMGRAAGWLAFDPTGGNEVAGYFYEYLNMLFLLDVSAFSLSVNSMAGDRGAIGDAIAH